MSRDAAVPLVPLPLLPPPGGQGAALVTKGAAALKSSSLSRLDELQQYLKRCDDQLYLKSYIKVGLWVLWALGWLAGWVCGCG